MTSFCGCFYWSEGTIHHLPTVKVNAHATILDTISRTTLTQTFINSNQNHSIFELRYGFPIYDGVSVVAFNCTIGDRTIIGVVKERSEANQEFKQAQAQGRTAGLFQQSLNAADVFTTTVGNCPPSAEVKVEITYLGELKHDAEVDGLRFTIPTSISPRYGTSQDVQPGSTRHTEEGISFTIDMEMPKGSTIKSVQSPSHPLSVQIGTTSKSLEAEEPSLRKASATHSLGSTTLDKDFIVQIVATKLAEPAAFLETHSTLTDQRALMATLVPRFKLPAEKPEVVFICDRSGSMGGKMPDLIEALNIFLKSLPVGVKFNICSFGTHFSFLWPKSQTYNESMLDQAVRHVSLFGSDFGGTEIYGPVEATFKQRFTDMNLEVFILTDGQIHDQNPLFELINDHIAEAKGAARVFGLGVGSGASTSLVEGIARAGKGFAQFVNDGEKMNKKVVRMLKGALSPHINDYSLEIKYENTAGSATDEDFEIVEKVFDSLTIQGLTEDENNDKQEEKPPISLFNHDQDEDEDTDMIDNKAQKYDHLPDIPSPRYLQTPSQIPTLFTFNRTTVYVLLSDSTPHLQPRSVILKATSQHGPLVLEIPITNLPEKSTTIHQLAARKEVKELEEGRGWISFARTEGRELLETKYPGNFSNMVEREAVRLGVRYQVGGKFCSFVAVEQTSEKEGEPPSTRDLGEIHNVNTRSAFRYSNGGFAMMRAMAAPRQRDVQASLFSAPGSSVSPRRRTSGTTTAPNPFGGRGALFGSISLGPNQYTPVLPSASAAPSFSVSHRRRSTAAKRARVAPSYSRPSSSEQEDLFDCSDHDPSEHGPSEQYLVPAAASTGESMGNPLQTLTRLQSFMGYWTWHDSALEETLGFGPRHNADWVSKLKLPESVAKHQDKDSIVATACAIMYFSKKLKDDKEAWEMLVEKAETWLEGEVGEEDCEELKSAIGKLIEKH